jgi:hypothetical protein
LSNHGKGFFIFVCLVFFFLFEGYNCIFTLVSIIYLMETLTEVFIKFIKLEIEVSKVKT